MKTLALVVDAFGFFGGPERRAFRIIKGLRKYQGYKPVIISIMQPDASTIKKAEKDSINVIGITNEGNSSLKSYRIDVFLKLRKVIQSINPDLVFTFEFLADYTTKMALLGIGLPIYTFIGSTTWKWEKKLHRKIAMRVFVKKSRKYIVNSKNVKENLIRVLPSTKDKIELIYNPIDTDYFKPLEYKNKIASRKKYNLSADDFIVGSVVRFYNPKGADTLIEAFYKADIDAKLVLVGSGSQRKMLEKMVEDLKIKDRVIFLGALEADKTIYSMFDMCVIPSQKGGFDNVVIESMACGVPTIATKSTGIEEIAKNNEDLLITDIDAESIGKNMKFLFRNYNKLGNKLSVNGRNLIENKLSIKLVAGSIGALIK